MRKKKKTSIEALRFLFMMQICLWHYGYPVMDAGFVGVEFFFILSGFFIYLTSVKPYSGGIVQFTIQKTKKFYVKYVFATLLGWIVFGHTLTLSSMKDMLHALLMLVSQLLMLQSVGIFEGGLNAPLWFFSVLIVGGAFVYGAVKYYCNISLRFIFPLVVILFLTYCFSGGKSADLEVFDTESCIPMTLMRGVCEMAYGSLIGFLFTRYGYVVNRHIFVLNMLTLFSIVLYLLVMIADGHDISYVFIFVPVFIIAAMTRGSSMQRLFSHEIWGRLGALSFDLYLIHAPLIALIKHFLLREFNINFYLVCVVYYLMLIPTAILFDRFVATVGGKIKFMLKDS